METYILDVPPKWRDEEQEGVINSFLTTRPINRYKKQGGVIYLFIVVQYEKRDGRRLF